MIILMKIHHSWAISRALRTTRVSRMVCKNGIAESASQNLLGGSELNLPISYPSSQHRANTGQPED